jgi:hypothetical protein
MSCLIPAAMAVALATSAARADDSAPAAASAPSATAHVAAKPVVTTPAKQWVWLSKQGVWGYGYQREDGLWVIDPGSKRAPAPQATQAPAGDPYGFLGWLNATRASVGLPAVGYDANLSAWASMNNVQQNSIGLGHHVMGPARRQNSAMGNAASIGAQWMASPAHRSALLDPSIRMIGIAGLGAYWTFNAY